MLTIFCSNLVQKTLSSYICPFLFALENNVFAGGCLSGQQRVGSVNKS